MVAAAGLLKPGGNIIILDLARHGFEQARQLYGDRWLGFTETELQRWLEAAGLSGIEIIQVAREEQPPQFETLLATATR